MKEIQIYTDGACSGNPGPGGYGVVLCYGEHRKELGAGFARTTNNRMELSAAIAGLAALREPCAVKLYSDSSYLVNAVVKKWLPRWKRCGWRKADKQPVANVDLWEKLLLLTARHPTEFIWVKGHASNVLNNRCDELARNASAGKNLPADAGFQESE